MQTTRKRCAQRFPPIAALWLLSAAAAGAATRYVLPTGSNTPPYTNWTTAAHTIQAAINASTSGDTVRVGPATYTLTAAVVVDRGVTLMGDPGASSTIVHGSGTTNCFRMTHTGAVLRGFTIRNGRAREGGGIYMGTYGVVEECVLSNNYATYYGGGLYLRTNALVRNCTISSNASDSCGGGIYFRAGGRIEDSTLVRNYVDGYGGGLYFESSSEGNGVRASRLLVAGNVADWEQGGGACGWDYSYAAIEDSTFITNKSVYYGGGIYLSYGGAIRRCKLLGNRADDSGGGIYADYIDALESCVIAGNSAYYGGGAYVYVTPMWNLTVVGNQATSAGGIYTTPSAPLRDSIVVGNTATEYPNVEVDRVSAEHCCIDPPPEGTGNFAGPADFVNAPGGDYRLATNSPCVDAGSPSGFPALDVDRVPRGLDGNNDGVARNDIGAYELLHPAADSDRDGLTDATETAIHHTSPTDPDCDDDGQNDGDEMVAGTDPHSPASSFRVTQWVTDPVAGLALTWWSSTGRLYSVVSATSLVAGDWSPAPGGTDMPGTGGLMGYSYGGIGPSRYIRLVVRLAP